MVLRVTRKWEMSFPPNTPVHRVEHGVQGMTDTFLRYEDIQIKMPQPKHIKHGGMEREWFVPESDCLRSGKRRPRVAESSWMRF